MGTGFFDSLNAKKATEAQQQEKATVISKPTSIPPGYHEITLSSCGRLSTPLKIHVRDYYNADVLRISQSQDNVFKEILNFLVDGIYEDVNPYMLHEKELEEIMLNIYGAFWDPIIKGYYYPSMLTDEQELEELKAFNDSHNLTGTENEKKFLGQISQDFLYVDIDIRKIDIKPISLEFKEPIVCTSEKDGITLYLRLPRVGDILDATNYVDKVYAIQDQIFKSKGEIGPTHPDYDEYVKYATDRSMDIGIAVVAKCLLKMNDEIIDGNLERQMNVYKSIPRTFWSYCWSEVKKHQDSFGANPEVEVISPITKQKVKRRCQFQLVDLIPSGEVPESSGYACRYGD